MQRASERILADEAAIAVSLGTSTLSVMDVPVRIEVEDGERVLITWEDGPASELTARDLRAACQCAGCREDAGIAATQALLAGDLPIRIAGTKIVGNYALSFDFEPDGHGTGIYSYDVLRALAAEISATVDPA